MPASPHAVDERLAQRMRLAHIAHRERPADAVQLVLAALLVLGAAEIRQHVGEAPAGIAELAPVIEVLRLPADVKSPLIDEEPPITLPRGWMIERPPSSGSGSEL